DATLQAIALAPESETTAALARRLGVPVDTAYKARRRIRRDGWACVLTWVACSECGEPACGPPQTGMHLACRPDAAARRQRARRADNPGLSTPYVRTWRERHPERNR